MQHFLLLSRIVHVQLFRGSYIVPPWHGLSQGHSSTALRASVWFQERASRRNCPADMRWPGWSTRTRTRPLLVTNTARS